MGFNSMTLGFSECRSVTKLLVCFSAVCKAMWLFLGSALNNMIRGYSSVDLYVPSCAGRTIEEDVDQYG